MHDHVKQLILLLVVMLHLYQSPNFLTGISSCCCNSVWPEMITCCARWPAGTVHVTVGQMDGWTADSACCLLCLAQRTHRVHYLLRRLKQQSMRPWHYTYGADLGPDRIPKEPLMTLLPIQYWRCNPHKQLCNLHGTQALLSMYSSIHVAEAAGSSAMIVCTAYIG